MDMLSRYQLFIDTFARLRIGSGLTVPEWSTIWPASTTDRSSTISGVFTRTPMNRWGKAEEVGSAR